MANITELNEKVDALQVALDAEQEQIAALLATNAEVIVGLQETITSLQALVVDGGTAEERQAVADKLDAIKADLEATVA